MLSYRLKYRVRCRVNAVFVIPPGGSKRKIGYAFVYVFVFENWVNVIL